VRFSAIFFLTLLVLVADVDLARAQCTTSIPDGRLLLPEDCDDGNTTAGDGCSASCDIEPGYTCRLPFSPTPMANDDYAGAAASWGFSADGRAGTQFNNSGTPVIAHFGGDATATTYQLQFRVNTTGDDDFIGLVLGYTPGESSSATADYLLVDWKQLDQGIGGGTSRRGLALSRVTGVPTANNFFLHTASGTGAVTELARGTTFGSTGWNDLFTHQISITYSTTRVVVLVDGSVEFDLPGSWPAGQVAFYGLSQSDVTYTVLGPLTSTCSARCGDSLIAPPVESCDDGNMMPGDGCGATCRREIAITSPPEGARTSDSTPTVAGTADPGASVTVVVGGVMLTATADATGAWAVTVPAAMALPDGAVSVTATAVSMRGGTTTDMSMFTIDSRTTVAITSPSSGSVTRDSTPEVRGTGEAGARVDVIIDDAVVATVTVAADGTWSATVPTALADGAHRARAEARDVDGNTASSGDVPFNVDTRTSLDITGPTGTTRDATPEITGTGEPGATVVVMVGGRTLMTTVGADGSWTVTPSTDLPNGMYTASATATDAAGNTAPDTQSFRVEAGTFVDQVQPTGTIGDATPEISGTAEPGASVAVSIDGTLVGTVETDDEGNWTLVVPTPLSVGAHTVSVTATATSGSMATDTGVFTLDAALPALEIRSPGDGTTSSDTTPTVSGQTDPGLVVTITIDGMVVGTATADSSGHWSLEVTMPLGAGAHRVRATTTDAAGRMATDEHGFEILAAAPGVTIAAPANGDRTADRTPRITGTADAGATVEVYIDGVLVGSVTAAADGAWSIDTTASLADGEHTVRAVATDAGGSATASGSFTVDASTTVVILEPADGSTTGDARPTYTGTAEPGATVTILVDGVVIGMATAAGDGSWTFDQPSDLAEGGHTVVARAVDDLGNTNEADNGFTVDRMAPDPDAAVEEPDAAVSPDAALPRVDGGRPDAAMSAGADAGPEDAAVALDAFAPPTVGGFAGGACGCSVPARTRTPASLASLLLLGWLWTMSRRRARNRSMS